MPVSETTASLLFFLRELYHSFLILRSLKLNFSWSSSDTESFAALAFKRLFFFRTYFTTLVTRAFISSPSSRRFLAPCNLTRPTHPPRSVYQVEFMALYCASMTLQKFILCPRTGIGHTGKIFFFFLFLFASSSKGLAAWYEYLLWSDLADWWSSSECLFFCFVDFLHPAFGKFPQKFLGAHRTQQDPWVLGLMSRTLELSVISATSSGVRNTLARGSRLLVGVVPPQREGTSWGIRPSSQYDRWSTWYLCCKVCITPFWGTSSGAEAILAKRNEKSDTSSLTRSSCLFSFPAIDPSNQKPVALLRWPSYLSFPNVWGPVDRSWPHMIL